MDIGKKTKAFVTDAWGKRLQGFLLLTFFSFIAIYPSAIDERVTFLDCLAVACAFLGAFSLISSFSSWLWVRVLLINFLFLPSVLEFIYAVRFEAGWDDSAVDAVMQSNPLESMAFISEFFSPVYYFLFLFCLLVPNLMIIWARQCVVAKYWRKPMFTIFLPAFFFLPSAYGALEGYFAYQSELANWKNELRKRQLGTVVAETYRADESFLVIIGESATRRHWSLYGYDRNTTPEMDSMSDLLVFRDLISSHSHTNPALGKALTSSLVSDPNSYGAPSIIDLANAAGFSTYWLSNQQRMGPYDNAVSVLAEAATHKKFINLGFKKSLSSNNFDESLLPLLRNVLSEPKERKLIILHLFGSHFPYGKRYPSRFEKFSGTSKSIDGYDNSIAYTDYVLGEAFRLAEEAGVDAVVYFSDHGEDVVSGLAHNSSRMTKAMVEIPFVVRLSERYRERYPETNENLLSSLDKPLSGDYIFHLLVRLLQFSKPRFIDPLAPSFSLPKRYVRNGDLIYETLE